MKSYEKNGLTLVALTITIIILLILIGVTIQLLNEESGVISKTDNLAKAYNNSVREQDNYMQKLTLSNENTSLENQGGEVQNSNIIIRTVPSEWTNEEVSVYLKSKIDGYALQYSLDEGDNWADYSQKITISEYGTEVATRLIKDGQVYDTLNDTVENIDIKPPEEFNITASDITSEGFKVSGFTADAEQNNTTGKSGIKEYIYYIKSDTDIVYESNRVKNIVNIFKGLKGETQYSVYVEACDNAGNKTKSNVISVKTAKSEKSVYGDVKFNYFPATWKNENVKVELTSDAVENNIQYSLDKGKTWSNYSNKVEVSNNGQVILARLEKDGKIGSTSTGIVLNIDKLNPESVLVNAVNITSAGFTINTNTNDREPTATSGKSGLSYYNYKIKNEKDSSYVTQTSPQNSFVYTGLNANTTYDVIVEVYDNAGNSSVSDTIKVTTAPRESDGIFDEEQGVNLPDITKLPSETTKYVTWSYNKNMYEEKLSNSLPADWYDYGNSKWANVKTTSVDGSVVAYWVWIPRFAYKLPESSTPKTIDVLYINGVGKEGANGEKCYYTTDKEITKDASGLYASKTVDAKNKWIVHPAFTFAGKQLSGIWVAKFEASSTNPYEISGGGDNTSLKVQIKTGVQSWRRITPENMIEVCLKMNKAGNAVGVNVDSSYIDTHMMKNMEWAAVAILSQSRYGNYNRSTNTNMKVWNNPNKNRLIGMAGQEADSVNLDDKRCSDYNEGNGPRASTTGNVYGIYDMAGGALEYIAAVAKGKEFKLGYPDSKYYDSYEHITSLLIDYQGSKIGDLIAELFPSFATTWNDDYAYFITGSSPLLSRGGRYMNSEGAGIFAFDSGNGGASNNYTFRPVMIIN